MTEAFPDKEPSPLQISLPPRTVLRMIGPDRTRFLSGQITQDVSLATETEATYTCILNAKGHLDGVCHLRVYEDSYLLDAPLALREPLMARLERYVIADDVEIFDESDDWIITHLLAYPDYPRAALTWETTRLGERGLDIFSRSNISIEGITVATEQHHEWLRVSRGIPEWGFELHSGQMPREADLEDNTVSYDKGCYIGQEVISRMKRSGRARQYLTQFLVPPDTSTPCLLYSDGIEAGQITSMTSIKRSEQGHLALGFRRRKFMDVESFSLLPEGDSSVNERVGVYTP